MISNINYKGILKEGVEKLVFSGWKPCQCVMKFQNYTIVVFRSGKCRVMGCKAPLDISSLPLPIEIECIQSVSITFDYGHRLNLVKMLELDSAATYEPEIFPALRINDFNPLCVNVFASGKVVVHEIKTLNFNELVDEIHLYIFMHDFQ